MTRTGGKSVFEPPDWSRLTHGATETYQQYESVDQIRPPYPATGSPNWWALRKRYEELLLGRIRKQRSGDVVQLPLNNRECIAAKWAALGNEAADAEYQRYAR